jgi:carbohydrate kinase (thermoresistant glucokinase family)
VRVVVMGAAGSGKTTVGERIAHHLGASFLEGDTVHPPANIAKMAAGDALTDADRWPWLTRLRLELAARDDIVITCSSLKRGYRDLLRRAGGVRFVHLAVDPATALERVRDRAGHFLGADLVASQFEALEPPGAAETDVAVVDAGDAVERVADQAIAALAALVPGLALEPDLADGGTDRAISTAELVAHVDSIVADHVLATSARRVLLVPPDHTRLHSRAGEITALLDDRLRRHGCEVGVLPAVGTHAPMGAADADRLFGGGIARDRLLRHDFRDDVVEVGTISSDEVEALSGGRLAEPVPVEVARELLAGWDLVISIGQVVPHEVIGMANFTKNLVIGLGGAATIDRSHFLGAVTDMELIMGQADSPVREVVDAAFDRFLDAGVRVLWVLTVIEATRSGVVHRGLFVGSGSTAASGGAAYRSAAALAAAVNIDRIAVPFPRVACWLDPNEFRTTWLGNKAIYRTRMAIADGGELIVLAPGVRRFGEDEAIDRLIRRHGYRGTDATLRATATDPELAANLGAAAHLIHGSTEGRFEVTYCTDPDLGGLTRAEVEDVGYRWRPLADELALLGVDEGAASGPGRDARGAAFDFIANPALGLWAGPGSGFEHAARG